MEIIKGVPGMKTNKTISRILIALTFWGLTTVTGAWAEPQNADLLIEQLKSEDPTKQLKAFFTLEIDDEEVMSIMVNAVKGKPCAIQDLENRSVSDKATQFIEILKQKMPPSKDESSYCNYYSLGSGQFGF